MHKFFAKTLFFGKNIEFLTECHSTNDEMLHRVRFGGVSEGAILWSDYQLKGKGQRGNTWESQRGKNLLFSIFLKPGFLRLRDQHFITFTGALAIRDFLLETGINAPVKIKWPNDIYMVDKKLAGILTESSIYQGILENVVLGIGLNVNQASFDTPTATSIRIVTGEEYDREELLEILCGFLEKYYLLLKAGKKDFIKDQYEKSMLWINERHVFAKDSNEFTGEILGIDEKGWLKIKTNNQVKTFNFREIQFIR